ncbi:MAG: hypothetical protein ACREH4_02920 [Vitreimonas sp.]
MVRLLFLLIIVAGVAGYFTRPDEAKMRTAAEAVLNDPSSLGQLMEGVVGAVAGQRQFNDYYVATKYVVNIGEDPVVECWGAFTQTRCTRTEQEAAAS